jgi:hypothetical protein
MRLSYGPYLCWRALIIPAVRRHSDCARENERNATQTASLAINLNTKFPCSGANCTPGLPPVRFQSALLTKRRCCEIKTSRAWIIMIIPNKCKHSPELHSLAVCANAKCRLAHCVCKNMQRHLRQWNIALEATPFIWKPRAGLVKRAPRFQWGLQEIARGDFALNLHKNVFHGSSWAQSINYSSPRFQ